MQGNRINPTQRNQKLVGGANASLDYQTLLGITGSGKTYTIANVIEDNCNLAV